jgi:hypothetical protein
MRENRLSGSEGGGAQRRSPYPYRPREWEMFGLAILARIPYQPGRHAPVFP